MLTLSTIEAFLITIAPAASAILGILIAVCTILGKFNSLIKSVKDNTENQQLRADLQTALKDNGKLRQALVKVIEAQTHVNYEDSLRTEAKNNDKKV